MRKRVTIVLAVLALATIGVYLGVPPYAQEGQPEPAAANDKPVTDAEVQLYIDVYKSMQADHGLKLEDALTGRGIALADFRVLERRIQSKSLLVERVRTSLLEYAKQQPVLAFQQPPARTTPELTPAAH